MPAFNFRPSKKLGQSFLADQNILNKIVKNICLPKDGLVLEIGAGKGILTGALAKKAKKVYALEIDKRLCDFLKKEMGHHDNISLINADILKFDIKEFIKSQKIPKPITAVGNIPYHITSPIIEYLIENIECFDDIYLTVQKEYALRLVAKPGIKDYSSLSCFVQYFTVPELYFVIKKPCFWPVPKVDSYFVRLKPRSFSAQPKESIANNEKLLFGLVRAAFNQRRKNIVNSLSRIACKEEIIAVLDNLGIDRNSRAEDISLERFIALSNKLEEI